MECEQLTTVSVQDLFLDGVYDDRVQSYVRKIIFYRLKKFPFIQADDFAQDVEIEIWKNRRQFNPERGPLAKFVSLKTRSALRDLARRRSVSLETDDVSGCVNDLRAIYLFQESIGNVGRPLGEPVRRRVTAEGKHLLLRMKERGASNKDIGDLVGLQPDSVKVLISRLRHGRKS